MEAEQFSNAIPEDDDAAKAEVDEAKAGDTESGAGDTANGEPEFSNAPQSSTAEFSNEAASELEAEQSQSPPRPPTGTVMSIPVAAVPPPSETVASMPAEAPMSSMVSAPADAEFSNEPVEESSSAPAEASPSSAEEPSAPAPAKPPPMCTVMASPSKAAPEAATADAKTENGDKKWEVADMSYIQNRTKDVNNFEARRNTADEPGGLIPGAPTVTKGSKDADGKWQTVGTGYIDHRTNDPNRLEIRRTTGDVGSVGAGALKDAGQQGSATVKKEGDGKWTVDVSYIGHRTGDTANLDRTFEKTDIAVYADPAVTKYPYEELQAAKPKDVDPTQKEAYLSDTEFQTVFGMDVAAFAKQPKWKKQNMKKAKELF